MTTLVKTVNLVEGFHNWEKAPKHLDFLQARHRHIFHIIMYFKVSEHDREIEIFEQQWKIASYLKNKYGDICEFGGQSCEMIALDLLQNLKGVSCEVNEDGLGGAVISL